MIQSGSSGLGIQDLEHAVCSQDQASVSNDGNLAIVV